MEKLKGKKLLILGGIRHMLVVAERAKEFGILVYVTDYDKDSPCKAIADKSFMVDATDVDAVVALCKEEGIDGIITGYVDMLLPYYAQICEKAGLPCYATPEQIDTITDKDAVKKLCKQYNVPAVPDFTEEQIANGEIDYPVVVKPADNSGSRGVTVCHDTSEFKAATEVALSLSKKKKVVVEKFMTDDNVLMQYYIQDGEPIFIGMGDVRTCFLAEIQGRICPLETFPSKYVQRYLEEVDPQFKAMIRGLGLKNGILEVESFLHNGLPCVGDVGYRLTGARLEYVFREIFGVYSIDLMIHFALTGRMADYRIAEKVDPYLFGKHAFKLLLALMPGTVTQIIGKEQLQNIPEVFHMHLSVATGDVFTEDDMGKYKQYVAWIYALAESEEDMINIANKIFDTIDFLDENGKSMKAPTNCYAELLKSE